MLLSPARRRAVEILGVYAEASGGQTPPVAAVPVLAFDAARLRLLEPSGALFYDYVYEALLWDQTYGVPDSVIEAFLAGMAAEMEALAARVQEAAGSRASFSPAAIEQVATVLLSAGLNETVAGWQWRGELQLVWVAAASLWGLSDTRQLLQQRRGHGNAPFPIQAE